MKKIIVRLEGGIGNQLFQYAFARNMQNVYGGEILFDMHTYKKDTQRNLSLNNLRLNSKIEDNSFLNSILIILARIWYKFFYSIFEVLIKNQDKKRKILSYLGIFKQDQAIYEKYLYPSKFPIKYIFGNWMSEKYFASIKNKLSKELTLKSSLSEDIKACINKLESMNSVCVHIRRGDYVNDIWKDKLYVCDFEYYDKAIKFISEKIDLPSFYVFSNSKDDHKWIKENYKFTATVKHIELNCSDVEELMVMSNCKHFIISNSTYSWWASYLSKNNKKITVAPSRWNNNIWDMKDIYLEKWELIKV